MFHKCDLCDYESNRIHNIRRRVKIKLESYHANNENQVDTKFSLSPQINDVIEGTKTPLGRADSKEVVNEEDDVYAEQRERIKMIMSSYDNTDSEDSQMNSESEDENIEDMEQVAAEMKNDVELNKTGCLYLHTHLQVTSI